MLGAHRFERPKLSIIPLGIQPEDLAAPGDKQAAQAAAPAQLNLPSHAQVVLLMGRLYILTKFNPGPLLSNLAELQANVLHYGESQINCGSKVFRSGLLDCRYYGSVGVNFTWQELFA